MLLHDLLASNGHCGKQTADCKPPAQPADVKSLEGACLLTCALSRAHQIHDPLEKRRKARKDDMRKIRSFVVAFWPRLAQIQPRASSPPVRAPFLRGELIRM